MTTWSIEPPTRPFTRTVQVPGSKSITNRALPLAAMATGESVLEGVLFADDTRRMLAALQAMGYSLDADESSGRVRLTGRGRDLPEGSDVRLACGNSGTTIRFLTAMLSLGHGSWLLDGVERMRERPIDELVSSLRALGAGITYEGRDGFPPVRVQGGLRGGTCTFADAKSSQFISAVLMAAPLAREPVTVCLVGPVTSEPYVDMTVRMMAERGVSVGTTPTDTGREVTITPQAYRAGHYAIEPDASNASYFLAAAAVIAGASITIPGLGQGSLQGDVGFGRLLGTMGASVRMDESSVTVTGGPVLHGIDVDMSKMPDMVQTLCVVALFAEGPTTARNVWNLRIKETDRLAALESELEKLGAAVSTGRDWIRVDPPATLRPARIATYDDHRMAMAFSVAALRVHGIVIEDAECVAKTYPRFFDDLATLL